MENSQQECLWTSVWTSALGGLAGSFAMNQFQSLMSAAQKAVSNEQERQKSSGGSGEDATVKTAEAITKAVSQHDLTESEKKRAGPLVHYAFGTTMGAAYGALAHAMPMAQAGSGAAFGTALWLGADEVAVPALGFSSPPSETPLSTHLSALAAHLLYGCVTDLVRTTLTRKLSSSSRFTASNA